MKKIFNYIFKPWKEIEKLKLEIETYKLSEILNLSNFEEKEKEYEKTISRFILHNSTLKAQIFEYKEYGISKSST